MENETGGALTPDMSDADIQDTMTDYLLSRDAEAGDQPELDAPDEPDLGVEEDGELDEVEETIEATDESQRQGRPSQSDRIKAQLNEIKPQYEKLQGDFGRQQEILDEVHQENLHYRAQVEDFQADMSEMKEYVSQLEEALERTTGWKPDPRDEQMRELRRELRQKNRAEQFAQIIERQRAEQAQQQQYTQAASEFADGVKDVARRFKVDPSKLARVALAERAHDQAKWEDIARTLRGASAKAQGAARQRTVNQGAKRTIRANGHARSRAPNSPDRDAEITSEMESFVMSRRGMAG